MFYFICTLRENLQDLTYTLDTKSIAVAHAGTVRAVCTDLSVKKKSQNKAIYKLSMQQHEEIIGSMYTLNIFLYHV